MEQWNGTMKIKEAFMLFLHFVSPSRSFVYASVTLPLHSLYALIFIFTCADSMFEYAASHALIGWIEFEVWLI